MVGVLPEVQTRDAITREELEMVNGAEAGMDETTGKETVECVSAELDELAGQLQEDRRIIKEYQAHEKELQKQLTEAMVGWREAYPAARFNFGQVVASPVDGKSYSVSVKKLVALGVDPELVRKATTVTTFVSWRFKKAGE